MTRKRRSSRPAVGAAAGSAGGHRRRWRSGQDRHQSRGVAGGDEGPAVAPELPEGSRQALPEGEELQGPEAAAIGAIGL